MYILDDSTLFEFIRDNNEIKISLKEETVIPARLTLQFILEATENNGVIDKTVVVIEIEQPEFKPYPNIFKENVHLGSVSSSLNLELNIVDLELNIDATVTFDVQDSK